MARTAALPIVTAEGGLSHYLEQIRRFPMLEPKEEYMLAKRWREHGDTEAAHKLAQAPRDDPATAEAIRAELRERFRRLAACDQANAAWQREREAHERQCAQARRTGAPLPPPLCQHPSNITHFAHQTPRPLVGRGRGRG